MDLGAYFAKLHTVATGSTFVLVLIEGGPVLVTVTVVQEGGPVLVTVTVMREGGPVLVTVTVVLCAGNCAWLYLSAHRKKTDGV
jgi:hypothetical protein